MRLLRRIYKSFMNGPVFIVVFGLIFFGIGAGLTYQKSAFERRSVQAQGEVIGLSTNCDDEGCSYSPVVRFNTQDGKTITFESIYSTSPPSRDVGEIVTVFYSPEPPHKAVIKGEGQVFRIIFMAVGGLVILLGLGVFSSNLRNNIFTE